MDPDAAAPIKPLSTYTPQSDSSKFIRTYAKDVAVASGQPTEASAPIPQSATTTPKEIVTDGVGLADYDPSPVNHAEPASPKEFEQEVVDLKSSDSIGLFASQGSSASSPTPFVMSAPLPDTTPLPVPEPAPEPTREPEPVQEQAPILPPEPVESAADREAILARLRAKVSAERAVTATAPVVTESPIRAAAPDFSMTPEPVLPMPQLVKEEVAPMPPAENLSEGPSRIHTFSSDFASRIDASQGSTFSVLAAQSDAGQTPRPVQPRKRTLAPLLAGIAMLLIGIGAVAGAYFFTRQGVIPTVATAPALIKYDESVEVKGSGRDLMQAVSNVGQGGSVSGNVVVTYVTLATTTGAGIPQPGGVLIRDLALPAPDILLRNLDDTSTVGVIRAGSESRPFMILKVNSYERTFAGMLAWEPTMASDLALFYPPYPSAPVEASSTFPTIAAPAPTSFSDAVVANYDVRVLRDSSGRSLLLYGYRGRDVLIIARDEAAFTALISRLSASGN